MLVVFFFAGDVSAEAEVDFLVVEELFFVLVVDAADVDIASSFFWVWQPRNAVNVSAVIKVKTDVFIVLSLTLPRMSIPVAESKHENTQFFPFKTVSFFRS